MKWLKYLALSIVAVIGLGVIVLLLLGGARGQSRLVASVDIAQPVGLVFEWVSEPQKIKSWVSWMVDIRDMTPGRSGPGAKQLWVMEDRNNGNQRMDIESEIVRYEPGRLLEARLKVPEGFTGEVRYELEPMDANRTRLTYRANYQFDHWLARLLEPIISRSAQQKLEDDLARLKQQAEAK